MGGHAAPEAGGHHVEDALVLKGGRLFARSRPQADMRSDLSPGDGLYSDDTRWLRDAVVTLDGSPLEESALERRLAARQAPSFALVTAPHRPRGGWNGPPLRVTRTRLLHDAMYETVRLTNPRGEPVTTELEIALGADFADIFDVRGYLGRARAGEMQPAERCDRGFRFRYLGSDAVERATLVRLTPPDELELEDGRARASWSMELEPGVEHVVELVVAPMTAGRSAPPRSRARACRGAQQRRSRWLASCAQISTDHAGFNRLLAASTRDLEALSTPVPNGNIVAAGVPWYVAPFGRDALLAGEEALLLRPRIARDALLLLARHQAARDDPARDAEPGKILHELRYGELARSRQVPQTPYYGSVDATPLFLMLAGRYLEWTGDVVTLARLRPRLEAALRWLDDSGDRDGDGFVEYARRAERGLANQGWKDSVDSVVHADGSQATGPIALAEVQGYAYAARLAMAAVYERLGEPDLQQQQAERAAALKRSFNEAFWMPEEGFFAFALDGDKRRVASITSNPGQCLWSGVIDPGKAGRVAARLLSPELFSGWGVRTLSAHCPAYDPASYHRGSVWPHDNALIAEGLARYGLRMESETVTTALVEAASRFAGGRIPELFCGYDRVDGRAPVTYPVACSPQAWAAAVPFVLLRAWLGLAMDVPRGTVALHRPWLPSWLGSVTIERLQVGARRARLRLTRSSTGVTAECEGVDGTVGVAVDAGGGRSR